MHRAIPGHFSGICIIMLCLLSCHGNPATPDAQFHPDPLPAQTRTAGQSHHCFGYYSLIVDTGSMEIKTLPLRSAELHLNVTGILNSTMGVTAAGVPGEHDPPNGIFVFDITLTHPFPLKSNLAGFDVKGILISPGSLTINNLIFGNTLVLNGDGYSRWWNPTEFTDAGMFGYVHGNLANQPPSVLNAQVNPYKYFADILDATTDLDLLYSPPLDDDQGRGVFSAGASNTRRYRIKFPLDPEPDIRYGYAIDASWAAPSPNPPSEIPDDFPIEANQPEPYIVDLKVTKNSLFYDTESGNCGGVLRLMTTIRDWQGQLNGNTFPEAGSVRVYCPSLYTGGIDFYAGGTLGDAAIFLHDLTGIAQPSWAGDATLAVEVISSDGTTYDQGLGYPAPSDAVAAWDVIEVPIVDPPCEADSNNDFDTAADIGLKDSAIGYLCEGVDNVDYYKLQIPYGEEVTFGTIYANASFYFFSLILYDQNYNMIAQLNGQDLEMDLSSLDLHSGTYYVSVSTLGTSGDASTYFLETDIYTESLPPLNPTDISTGFLDLEAEWVKIHGDYLYMAGETGIWVYDVSDMLNPVPVYRSYESVNGDPAFFYPHMYFISGDPPLKLHYIDFTAPTQPVNYGWVFKSSSSMDLATMSDTYLYFYEAENDLVYIYDYSTDPTYPAHIVNFGAFNGVEKMDCLCPSGAYTSILMMSSSVFAMYNVEDVYNVQQTGFELLYNTMNRDFDIYGDAIVKVHTTINPISNRLRTYNINFDYTLAYQGYVDLPEKPEYVAAIFPYTQVTGADTNNIMTVNIVDPVNPELISTYVAHNELAGIDGIPNELYAITKYRGLWVFDISHPIPWLEKWVRCLNNPVLGRISNDVGYFYDHKDDYRLFKTVNFFVPSNPNIVGIYGCSNNINDIEVTSEGVYLLVDGANYIGVYSITGPGQLSWVMSYNLPHEPLSAAVRGNFMYVALATGNEMKVFDVSDPTTFAEVSTVTIQTPVEGLIAHGNALYGIRNDQVTIYDITDPQNPVEQTSWDASGYDLKSLATRDHYLYVSTATDLLTLDISDPLNPVLADTLSLPNPPDIQYMTLDEQYLYSCNGDVHPYVTDISSPGSPGGYSTPFSPDPITTITGIIGYEGHLYEMTEGSGVRVWDLYP